MTGAPYSRPAPLVRIPDAGRHYRLDSEVEERRALATALGIADIEALTAELLVKPGAGRTFRVEGELVATVVQADVVTLDPVRQEVREAIDLTLAPAAGGGGSGRTEMPVVEERDVYRGTSIDLGVIVAEHLALGLDPYPRSPGVEFEGHIEEAGRPSPFAALAALKDRKSGKD